MNIVHRTDLTRNVHHYTIQESVSIIEEFGIYTIFSVRTDNAEPYFREAHLRGCSTDLEEAKFLYSRAGGIWEE